MTDITKRDQPANRTAFIRDSRLLSICTECEHCKGTIIGNVGNGSDYETIVGYFCANPAKTSPNGTGYTAKNPLTCAYKNRSPWAYDKREELYDEIKKLDVDNRLLRNQLSVLESRLNEKDEYIEKLRKLIKICEHENLKEEKEEKESQNSMKEGKHESNPWDI